jgi:uncharacterized protein (DUF488 family)
MDKINVVTSVESKDYDTGERISIQQHIDYLNDMIANGATHISISAHGDYDGIVDDVEITTLNIREESDEEYEERLVNHKAYELIAAARKRAVQLAEYNRLQKDLGL